METLLVFESASASETAIAGQVTRDEKGQLKAQARAGSAKAAAFEAAWQKIRGQPTLPLRTRELAGSGPAAKSALHVRDVGPADPGYLWAVQSAMLGGFGLRAKVEDEDDTSWSEG